MGIRYHSIDSKAFERREEFAWKLNENPDMCWLELWRWAQGYVDWIDNDFSQHCRPENEGTPYAYCGKCEKYFEEYCV